MTLSFWKIFFRLRDIYVFVLCKRGNWWRHRWFHQYSRPIKTLAKDRIILLGFNCLRGILFSPRSSLLLAFVFVRVRVPVLVLRLTLVSLVKTRLNWVTVHVLTLITYRAHEDSLKLEVFFRRLAPTNFDFPEVNFRPGVAIAEFDQRFSSIVHEKYRICEQPY